MSERARIATHQIGHLCAQNGIQLISGGARGVDTEGMQTVLDDGGNVIGFVADSLLKTSVNGNYRQGLREQRLVLVTANDPKTPFSVGNAMARNKFVYCLSDWTLVIASSYNEGGTWAGAIENLKNRWVPLFVRKDVDVPEGNYRLIDKGGITLPPESFSIPERFMGAHNNTRATSEPLCVSDLTTPYPSPDDLQKHREPVLDLPENTVKKDEENILVIPETKAGDNVTADIPDIWPSIEEELKEPKTDRELARQFKVGLKQMRSWLSAAVGKGDIKKLTRPVRYVKYREKNSLDIWIEK
jgi:predicted Rossmann fold nucleotide-binding protein DprA/Smf involved in DNA uptake